MWAADKWVKTAPADLQTGDIVVIVDQTSSKAMSNNNGTSAPSAIAVTLNGAKDEISSEVATTLQWTLTTSGSGDSKTFQFANSTDYLYVTATNNGLKVGSGDRNMFTVVTGGTNSGYYLYNKGKNGTKDDERYVGCYNSADWRCYTSIGSNISGNNNAFYKKTTVSGAVDPSGSVTISATTIPVDGTATISGPAGLTISYESNNTSVATVSDAGVVTGVATGSAKITATWSAIADTYTAGSKDFDVTIAEATIYEKVTSMTQMVAGNKYILVATGNNRAMGAENSKKRAFVDVTITDDAVTIIDEAVAELTLGGAKDAWTFLASDNSEYLAYSGSSNELHTNADGTEDASKWKVTADFQLESANVEGRVLKYNSGSPRFACYASGQQNAVLFVKRGSKAAISINEACTDGEGKYYGTFSLSKAFIVPEGLTVSEICVIDNELLLENYATGDVVPANTGVMVSAATAGDKTITLTTGGTSKLGSDNLLKPSGDAGITAANMTEANTKFYRLTMHDGSKIGFWWGAEDGAAFNLAANKAYLAVPTGTSAPSFFWFGGDVTAIKGIEAAKAVENGAVFNLNGQRVAQPTKGLYIVNGRKVVIK